MDKKVTFEVEKFSILDDYSDSQFAVVELYVCHDGNNLHDLPIELEVLKDAKRTLKNKPLLAGYDGKDFKGHETPGLGYYSVGVFPESSKMEFVEENGKTYLVAQAIMWKHYAKWAYDIFTKDNERSVSMEISVLGLEKGEDDLEHITKFVFNGVTLLGKKHFPACEGADASIIKFSKENALEVYSKHFKTSTNIKKKFVENMKCVEISGKEGTEIMENEEITNTVTEPVVETPEVTEPVVEISEVVEDVVTPEGFEGKQSVEETPVVEETVVKETVVETPAVESEPVDFASLTMSQKREILCGAMIDMDDTYMEDFDDEYVYIRDYNEGATYRMPYTISDNVATISYDSKVKVVRGGYVEFSENGEEGVETVETLKTEIGALKERLAEYETAEKNDAVESILADVIDTLPAEKISELREESKNYSLDNLSAFENEVKAMAFEAVKQTKSSKYSFTKMTVTEIEKPTSKYSWR